MESYLDRLGTKKPSANFSQVLWNEQILALGKPVSRSIAYKFLIYFAQFV